MNIKEYPWHKIPYLPFVERRQAVAYLSTGPIYDAWTQYRLVWPWH